MRAQGLVTGAVLATGALAVAGNLTRGEPPSARIVVGTFVTGAALTALARKSPELAGAAAVLLLTTAVFRTSPEVFQRLRASASNPQLSERPQRES